MGTPASCEALAVKPAARTEARLQLVQPAQQRVATAGHLGAWIAFGAVCLIWGTTFAAIRVAVATIPTLLVTGSRFLLAGGLLFVLARLAGRRFPQSRTEWRDQAICGVLMVGFGNTLLVYSEHELSSGLAALLAAAIPIWMAILEAVSGSAVMTKRKLAGLALGFGGVALLAAPAIDSPDLSLKFLLAVAATQLSSIAWTGGTLYGRSRGVKGDPVASAAVQMLSGGAFAMTAALVTGARPTAAMFTLAGVGSVVYLAILGSVVGYTAYLYALTKLPPGKVASYAYVNPAVAVVVGAVLLGEAVTGRMMTAMAVIFAGVALITMKRRIEPAPERRAS